MRSLTSYYLGVIYYLLLNSTTFSNIVYNIQRERSKTVLFINTYSFRTDHKKKGIHIAVCDHSLVEREQKQDMNTRPSIHLDGYIHSNVYIYNKRNVLNYLTH